MAERTVTSEELAKAFEWLRALWKRLFDELPPRDEIPGLDRETGDMLEAVAAAARVSREGGEYVRMACLIRIDRWRPEGAEIPSPVEEAASAVRTGFEMRLRTLRQMESGDEILPDSGKELRRTVARDLVFFREVRRLGEAEGEQMPEESVQRLVQSFDTRRKVIREEVNLPNPALEAVEFLVRLGAS